MKKIWNDFMSDREINFGFWRGDTYQNIHITYNGGTFLAVLCGVIAGIILKRIV